MKAICVIPGKGVTLQQVPKPEKAEPGHLIIKMEACGINPGDIAFINRPVMLGVVPVSRYDIYGVSGVGKVLEVGEGVPDRYKGKNVLMYRSLKISDSIVGTWSEYTHMHYLHCAILPENVKAEDYAGSLVNIITPYAFIKQVSAEGHKGIICTAGTSATGTAMLGICQAYNFPLISIVRNEAGKKELVDLGAQHVVAESSSNFKAELKELGQQLGTTAVFDGVGGEILNKIIDVIPTGSAIFCYGYLGGPAPLSIHTSMLQVSAVTIKAFSNFRTDTVQNPQNLEKALTEIGAIIHMPHFKTRVGGKFKPEEINEALRFSSENGKAVLYPGY